MCRWEIRSVSARLFCPLAKGVVGNQQRQNRKNRKNQSHSQLRRPNPLLPINRSPRLQPIKVQRPSPASLLPLLPRSANWRASSELTFLASVEVKLADVLFYLISALISNGCNRWLTGRFSRPRQPLPKQ